MRRRLTRLPGSPECLLFQQQEGSESTNSAELVVADEISAIPQAVWPSETVIQEFSGFKEIKTLLQGMESIHQIHVETAGVDNTSSLLQKTPSGQGVVSFCKETSNRPVERPVGERALHKKTGCLGF